MDVGVGCCWGGGLCVYLRDAVFWDGVLEWLDGWEFGMGVSGWILGGGLLGGTV